MEPKLCGVKAVGSDQIMFLGVATEEVGDLVHVNIGYSLEGAVSDVISARIDRNVMLRRFIMQSLWFHRDSVVFQ